MTWPTFAEVEDADIEQLRKWINGLPGCDLEGQRSVIRRIIERIVATWPRRSRPLMPVDVQALADLPRPVLAKSATTKRNSRPSAGPEINTETAVQGALHFMEALKRS